MNILYENIRKRRKELNMSQQELAEAVGYSGKSMVSQVEKGLIDISSTMISKFADALHCTESYLMGWEDINGNTHEDIIFTKQMQADDKYAEIIRAYSKASPEIQKAVELLLKADQPDS